jgi:hypothetical protein
MFAGSGLQFPDQSLQLGFKKLLGQGIPPPGDIQSDDFPGGAVAVYDVRQSAHGIAGEDEKDEWGHVFSVLQAQAAQAADIWAKGGGEKALGSGAVFWVGIGQELIGPKTGGHDELQRSIGTYPAQSLRILVHSFLR